MLVINPTGQQPWLYSAKASRAKGAYNIFLLPESFTDCTDIILQ